MLPLGKTLRLARANHTLTPVIESTREPTKPLASAICNMRKVRRIVGVEKTVPALHGLFSESINRCSHAVVVRFFLHRPVSFS